MIAVCVALLVAGCVLVRVCGCPDGTPAEKMEAAYWVGVAWAYMGAIGLFGEAVWLMWRYLP